jgi:GATA-binding protein
VNGGFTADGGAGAGGVQQQVPGYYTVLPTDALALGNHFFSNLSDSHPDRARIPDWTSPSNMASQSYSGPSSFSSAYPHAYGAPMARITASSVTASNPFQQPVSPGLAPPSSSQNMDHSLLALHRSLDVQAQGRSAHSSPYGSLDEAGSKMREGALKRSNSSGTKARGTRGPVGGAPGSTASSAASRSRYKTHPAPQGGPHGPHQSHSALTSPSVSPPLHYSNHPLAPGTFQRALPALPRRTSSAVSAASSTVSTPQPSYSMPPAFPSPSLSRASSVLSPTPPISRPVSPRIPGVDYGFTALEKDLDLYASGGFTAASAQSPHAMAGYGGRGYESPQLGGDNTPSPNMIANVLGESIFGSQSARSPTETGGESGDSNGAGSRHATAGDSATTSNKVSPNSGDVASPTGSTSIDDETGEALSKKDPISAQVWRMFNKAKTTLPNGARMENLTWRLMSMTLKKRRQETAALEAEAAAAGLVGQSAPSPGTAAEEADEVGQLRGRTGRDAGKGKGREDVAEVVKVDREDEGRGRKGRTPTSIEASPEVEE